MTDRYVDALTRELQWRRNEIEMPPRTIYIGGGTPSILTEAQIERLFHALPTEKASEITIEVNPEDVSERFARFLAGTPVNRVSMGVQSMDNEMLRSVGRRHTAEEAEKAVELLRDAGISNLSLDLIFGLPGQDEAGWEDTLRKTLALEPEHLSAYSLMYEPGTRLSAMLRSGRIKETAAEVSERMYETLRRYAEEYGMEHYEISNFALPGYRSKHNSAYWNLTPYLGLGAAAHSFDGEVRRHNPSDLRRYAAATGPIYETETTDEPQRINEYLLIRLRTAEGIDLSDFGRRFGEGRLNGLMKRAERFADKVILKFAEGRMAVKPEHWLITDSVLVDLFV